MISWQNHALYSLWFPILTRILCSCVITVSVRFCDLYLFPTLDKIFFSCFLLLFKFASDQHSYQGHLLQQLHKLQMSNLGTMYMYNHPCWKHWLGWPRQFRIIKSKIIIHVKDVECIGYIWFTSDNSKIIKHEYQILGQHPCQGHW